MAMAIGFALSALAAKMSGNGARVRAADLASLGNRDGFYVLLLAFLALLALAPAALPGAAPGGHGGRPRLLGGPCWRFASAINPAGAPFFDDTL